MPVAKRRILQTNVHLENEKDHRKWRRSSPTPSTEGTRQKNINIILSKWVNPKTIKTIQ